MLTITQEESNEQDVKDETGKKVKNRNKSDKQDGKDETGIKITNKM